MITAVTIRATAIEGGQEMTRTTVYNARETAYWETERLSLGLSREEYLSAWETRCRRNFIAVHSLVIQTN